ncbi:MAG: hypothetical protein A2579_02925 [Lysobacterales bacterium RIFOXYD1_FULL_69_11]|nr:MAG: hypothetical protein A2190_01775 [Xanthomonadales bacterium RIFOXYA1_FULL_69_10]OHE86555.1 MAG: hypothetical protein A2579_02925 [Xanthomonadales bacterium RIFOXYD1_FULL_69_11]
MKSKIAAGVFSVLALCTALDASKDAKAWKPTAPYCYMNCGIPIGDLSANATTVAVPAGSALGSVTLSWKWDWYHGGAMFPLACVYVRANAEPNFRVFQCEWPGNRHHSVAPWIAPGSMYTFVLAPYSGDVVGFNSVFPLPGTSPVDVVGIRTGGGSGGGGGGGGGGGTVIN